MQTALKDAISPEITDGSSEEQRVVSCLRKTVLTGKSQPTQKLLWMVSFHKAGEIKKDYYSKTF
jgi:hypothetical protein